MPDGIAILAPLSCPLTFPAEPSRSQSRGPVNRFFVPRVIVPAKTTFPLADRDRTMTQQSPRVAARTRCARGVGRVGATRSVDVNVTLLRARVAVVAGVETTVGLTEERAV